MLYNRNFSVFSEFIYDIQVQIRNGYDFLRVGSLLKECLWIKPI